MNIIFIYCIFYFLVSIFLDFYIFLLFLFSTQWDNVEHNFNNFLLYFFYTKFHNFLIFWNFARPKIKFFVLPKRLSSMHPRPGSWRGGKGHGFAPHVLCSKPTLKLPNVHLCGFYWARSGKKSLLDQRSQDYQCHKERPLSSIYVWDLLLQQTPRIPINLYKYHKVLNSPMPFKKWS